VTGIQYQFVFSSTHLSEMVYLHYHKFPFSPRCVRFSVTLADCYHIMQQKVEIGTLRDIGIGRCLGYLQVESDPDRNVLCSGLWKKCGVSHFGGIHWLACCTVSASAELIVFFRTFIFDRLLSCLTFIRLLFSAIVDVVV